MSMYSFNKRFWVFLYIFLLFYNFCSCENIENYFTSLSVLTPNINSTENTNLGGKNLKSNALLTCLTNSQFNVKSFYAVYYAQENTIEFNIDSFNTISESVLIKVEIMAYGINVISELVDPCSWHLKTLCPLNTGRIQLSGKYKASEAILLQIPTLVYKIPDIDIQIFVVAYSRSDPHLDKIIACVQTTLTNNKTVEQKIIQYILPTICGIIFILFVLLSLLGFSIMGTELFTLLLITVNYFQDIAMLGMLSIISIPPIASSWVQNFQWSMGIINIKYMQNIITWYIQSTNGISSVLHRNLDKISLNLEKRDHVLPEYYKMENIVDDSTLFSTKFQKNGDFNSKAIILSGINRVSFKAQIEVTNFFLTSFTNFLWFLLIFSVIVTTFKIVILLIPKFVYIEEDDKFVQRRKQWKFIVKGILFKILLIFSPQLFLINFWEFIAKDSTGTICFSIVFFIIYMVLLVWSNYRIIIQVQISKKINKSYEYMLKSDKLFFRKYGSLYSHYKIKKFWWLTIFLIYNMAKTLTIVLTQHNGKMGTMIKFIIELTVLILLLTINPYLKKITNIVNNCFQATIVINNLIFLFFTNLFPIRTMISSIMAVIFVIVNIIITLSLILLLLFVSTKHSISAYQRLFTITKGSTESSSSSPPKENYYEFINTSAEFVSIKP